ncbi:hypothetical protein GCM10023191_074020 [Actinoallomurus oryzae]|uniref:Apea-like HEPN domain-containing protein n=1 Tax=Actinoallomurus oryzae TaxID=502180 RepID=A0ABP8QV70_9ACTN
MPKEDHPDDARQDRELPLTKKQETVTVQAGDDAIKYLKQHLGHPFINWILADPTDNLTQQQNEVALIVADFLRNHLSDQPEIPAGLAMSPLTQYNPQLGTTALNYLHRYVKQEPPTRPYELGDDLLNALADLAAESYGELLIPSEMGLFTGSIMSPIGDRIVKAVNAEGIFPSTDDDQSGLRSVLVETSAGIATGFQIIFFGSGVLQAAWELAKLKKPVPNLDELIEMLPTALRQARSLFRGDRTKVISLVALTGIQLPEGMEISGDWGRIRKARDEDHPPFLKQMVERRTSATTPEGDTVEITDAGDVILETSVGMTMKVTQVFHEEISATTSTAEDVDKLVDRVRLAFSLAVSREHRPVLVSTWRRFIMPLSGGGISYNDPQHMAQRYPSVLSTKEAQSWNEWIDRIESIDINPLGVAVNRTLRAVSERRDHSDMLIDSVIAWESLLGATSESVLRVSAALAKLLHPPGAVRNRARTRYKNIYTTRSKIVHGNNKARLTAEQIRQDAMEATDVALAAIRIMLVQQRQLLPLDSDERSLRILLDDMTHLDPLDSES